MYNTYKNYDIQVRWKSDHSNLFPLMKGVKQGGCLSSIIFTSYLEELIHKIIINSGIDVILVELTVESLLILMTWLLYHPLFFGLK